MIEAAAKRIGTNVQRTPLLNSPDFDEIVERKVWVKAECEQHTNSFKVRGAWSAISALSPAIRKEGVIGFSSGNHGQALAFVASAFKIPALIVMPSDAPALKIDRTRDLGAAVILYNRDSADREKVASSVAQDRGMTLIKSFDNPEVIAGQGTTGLEIVQQAIDQGISAADVLVCCGGGGLLAGIALALESRAPTFRARPVEPEKFDDVTRSLRSGQIESNTRLSGSLCDAILTPRPGDLTWPIIRRLCDHGIVVSDPQALQGIVHAYEHFQLIAEPGGAVALATALFCGDQIDSDSVVCVVTGGNVDSDIFNRALNQFGTKA